MRGDAAWCIASGSTGLSLAPSPSMRHEHRTSALENAFSILRFRRSRVVSFRRFVVLRAGDRGAHDLRFEEGATQPMRLAHARE